MDILCVDAAGVLGNQLGLRSGDRHVGMTEPDAAKKERMKIVEWIRSLGWPALRWIARRIEKGEHDG